LLSALILRSGRRPRLEGWAASWFETRTALMRHALLTMRPVRCCGVWIPGSHP